MTGVFNIVPKRVARTSGTVLPHEKTVTTAAQHTNSPFSEDVGKIGGGSPWAYGIDYQRSVRNLVIMSIICLFNRKNKEYKKI